MGRLCCAIFHVVLQSDLFEGDVAVRSNGYLLGLVAGGEGRERWMVEAGRREKLS